MTLRGVIKSSLPVYFSDTVQAQRQLAPVYQGFFSSWLAALSPAKQRALEQG